MPDRIDPYRTIHKAVRHQLTAAVQQVSATDWADATAVGAALGAVDAALATQEEHAHHEDALYHPLLERHAPGSTERFAEQHRELGEHIAALEAEVASLRATDGATEAAGYALYLALARFVGEYLLHLDDEEAHLKPLFWAHCTDEELDALEGQVVAASSPDSMGTVLPHFLAALDPDELIPWLRGMQVAMPPPMFADVCDRAAAVVAPAAWSRVAAALGSG